jgi:hypothetical protein
LGQWLPISSSPYWAIATRSYPKRVDVTLSIRKIGTAEILTSATISLQVAM